MHYRRRFNRNELGMTARYQEDQKGIGGCLRAIEERRENVTVQMVDGVERFAQRKSHGFGTGDADHQAADQAGTASNGDPIELRECDVRALERVLDDGGKQCDVPAAGDFRNDSAELGVKRVLIRCDAGNDVASITDDSRSRVVARRFNSKQ
jgi:hypothetical protein